MIITLNMHSKRKYIKKILRNYDYFYSYNDEDINKITDYVLSLKQKGYEKHLFILFFDKYLDRVDIEIEKEIIFDICMQYMSF